MKSGSSKSQFTPEERVERKRQAQRRYKLAHPEKVAEFNQRYREKHLQEIREKNRNKLREKRREADLQGLPRVPTQNKPEYQRHYYQTVLKPRRAAKRQEANDMAE